MEMDELRAKWADYDRKLDVCIRLNQRLLGMAHLGRARSALQWLIVGMAAEATLDFFILLALGSFLYDHRAELPFAAPAAFLHLWVIVLFGALLRQIVRAAQVDYGQPISTIQRQLELLRASRLRSLQVVLLSAPLLWIPLLIVLVKGCLGLNAYALFDRTWLLANVAFGIAWIPLMLWAGKTFADRPENGPLLRRLLRAVSDHGVNQAEDFLQELTAFEEGGGEDMADR